MPIVVQYEPGALIANLAQNAGQFAANRAVQDMAIRQQQLAIQQEQANTQQQREQFYEQQQGSINPQMQAVKMLNANQQADLNRQQSQSKLDEQYQQATDVAGINAQSRQDVANTRLTGIQVTADGRKYAVDKQTGMAYVLGTMRDDQETVNANWKQAELQLRSDAMQQQAQAAQMREAGLNNRYNALEADRQKNAALDSQQKALTAQDQHETQQMMALDHQISAARGQYATDDQIAGLQAQRDAIYARNQRTKGILNSFVTGQNAREPQQVPMLPQVPAQQAQQPDSNLFTGGNLFSPSNQMPMRNPDGSLIVPSGANWQQNNNAGQ